MRKREARLESRSESNPADRFDPADESRTPVLSCRDLHRFLGAEEGRVHALRGVSATLFGGESCAVVGPSGCGKSTLLYILGLLDRPDSGEVWIGGRELSQAPDAVRTRARGGSIGFVFQFHFLLAEFTALENVMLPMIRLGLLPEAECRARAGHLLDQVGLEAKGNRRANHLSGGEQQRVAIARALANDPALVLADEPTGNLDAANAELVVDLLLGLTGGSARTVVMVTHNPEIASRCDRKLTMKDGVFV